MGRASIVRIGIRLLVLTLFVSACARPPADWPADDAADELGPTGTPTRPVATPTPRATATPTSTPRPSPTPTRVATATPAPSPTPTERERLLASKRAIHLPNRVLDSRDYRALDVLRPKWVVLLSAQLGDPDPTRQMMPDPRLQNWLRHHPEVRLVVRMWPVKEPPDPKELAARIVALYFQYPWVDYFIPANEPDIEWPNPSWDQIASWASDVWWNVEWYRRNVGLADIKLLYPPMSQWSNLGPEEVGYDVMRDAVERYLGNGDGFAGHSYWDRGNVYLVEDRYPAWLREQLSRVPYVVTEAGRRPVPENGLPGPEFGDELLEFAARTRASVVAPFILSSDTPEFQQHVFVDDRGIRPFTYAWAGRERPSPFDEGGG